MRLPPTIPRPAAPARRADAKCTIAALRCPNRRAVLAGTFEPLLAGDRQREKRVAKARNPVKSVRFEVSLS
jgi:hypothetical protein